MERQALAPSRFDGWVVKFRFGDVSCSPNGCLAKPPNVEMANIVSDLDEAEFDSETSNGALERMVLAMPAAILESQVHGDAIQ
jgi:hypothetical protein